MKSEIIIVTPEMAKRCLGVNPSNRKIRANWVAELAGAMQRGEWLATHQGIAFDEDGALLDGQHRLLAIIMAGIPVSLMVTRGLPRSAFSVLDRGRVRSMRDLTRHDNHVISAINMIGFLLSGRASLGGGSNPTHAQYMEIYDKFGAEAEYVLAHCNSNRKGMGAPVLTAVVVRLVNGQDAADQFKAMTALNFGAMTPAVQGLTRQIVGGQIKSREELMARSWRAFDLKNQGVTYIRVADPQVPLDEMREVVVRAFEQRRKAA